MDKKSKILLSILLLIILVPTAISYYHFFVSRNYTIYTQVDCDPQIESCYSSKQCSDGTDTCDKPDVKFYKILKIQASELSFCNHNIESCTEPKCVAGDVKCEYIKCNPEVQVGAISCGDNNTNQ